MKECRAQLCKCNLLSVYYHIMAICAELVTVFFCKLFIYIVSNHVTVVISLFLFSFQFKNYESCVTTNAAQVADGCLCGNSPIGIGNLSVECAKIEKLKALMRWSMRRKGVSLPTKKNSDFSTSRRHISSRFWG